MNQYIFLKLIYFVGIKKTSRDKMPITIPSHNHRPLHTNKKEEGKKMNHKHCHNCGRFTRDNYYLWDGTTVYMCRRCVDHLNKLLGVKIEYANSP